MNIGFDAKRAYHNGTGLGNYSRTLITTLSLLFPEHHYFLFNPKPSEKYKLEGNNLHEVLPQKKIHRLLPSIWRSLLMKNDILNKKIDLYHGLSHEIPVGIQKTGVKSIVTILDLIFLRYPHQYNPIDVQIYIRKFKYACKHADHIITISHQTKQDVVDYFGTDPDKITVCHISCEKDFAQTVSSEEKSRVRKMLGLPEDYFLYVGSIIERKNLMNICKAMKMVADEISIPLVVIGNGKKYKEKVKEFIRENGLEKKIIFMSDNADARSNKEFIYGTCFPAIYQSARALIYPSIFEGFGIPVLEGLWSKIPVITSNISSLPEVGGDAAYYVDPFKPEEIADGMRKIISDRELVQRMTDAGWKHAQLFTPERCAELVMDVYKKII